MTKARSLNVQTPGGTENDETDQLGAEANAPAPKSAAPRPSRARYLDMRADEVDAKTLTAAVLTKDGWVAPDLAGQKPKVA